MNPESLAALVVRAQHGDAGAFGEIWLDTRAQITRALRRTMSATPELLEDLTETVFLSAWEKLERYHALPPATFLTWLHTIARNLRADYMRAKSNAWTTSLDTSGLEYGVTDAKEIRAVDARQELRGALETLAGTYPSQYTAVTDWHLHGLSSEETGARIGQSSDAVKHMRQRGLARLRRLLMTVAVPLSRLPTILPTRPRRKVRPCRV